MDRVITEEELVEDSFEKNIDSRFKVKNKGIQE